jgi:hypothetical protein
MVFASTTDVAAMDRTTATTEPTKKDATTIQMKVTTSSITDIDAQHKGEGGEGG